MHAYVFGAILLVIVGSLWNSTYVPKTCLQCVLKSILRLVTISCKDCFSRIPCDDVKALIHITKKRSDLPQFSCGYAEKVDLK